MNILHRFNLLVKGRINAVLDALEDPERSLLQLVQDMEEELEAAKRAVARAMANEDRLRSTIAFHAQDAAEWQRAAERTLGKGDEAATERNYQRIDDELTGEDLRRRFEADAVADAVEERLARMTKTSGEAP